MLRQLTVNDVALVTHLDLNLAPGLTVLTGESGAGKSILLSALGLVLGARASTETIRPGAERADVSAEFDLSLNTEAQALLDNHELQDPDSKNRCLLRRVVTREGRSRAFVNGTPVTLGVMRELATGLVDIHGQDQSYRLAEADTQRRLLDDYGCKTKDLELARSSYRQWQAAKSQALKLEQQISANEDRAALLRYQLDELETLALGKDEFANTDSEFRRLAQGRELRQALEQALDGLAENKIGDVNRILRGIKDDQPALSAARDLINSADDLLTDAQAELRQYGQSLTVDAEQVAALETRLSDIHEMARKHKVAPEVLEAHITGLTEELAAQDTDRSAYEAAALSATKARATFEKAAKTLTKQRQKAATQFAKGVSGIMQTLGINGGELQVKLLEAESEHGMEAVELMVVTNPKYPAGPLAKIASGGEQARISLAISIIAAEKTELPCLVLDEADVGVGGTTADVIGRLLRNLASHTQVLCITHAPQVAALGEHHLRVHKDTDQATQIDKLSPAKRVEELARMLAGADVTSKSRAYAKTLLAEASA